MNSPIPNPTKEIERAQLKHVLLDVNLASHNKIIPLNKLFGAAGKCTLYEIYMSMSKATNAVIDRELIVCTAEYNGIVEPEAFISYCLSKKLIIEELDGYSNGPVIEDQESYYRKLHSDRNRKYSGNKRKDSVRVRKETIRVPKEPDIDNDTDNDNEDVISNKKCQPKTLYGEHVHLTDLEIQKFKIDLGGEILDRCINKLNDWIASDPTVKRRRNGKNAAATIRSWVINAVGEEQARGQKTNGPGPPKSQYDRAKETLIKSYEKMEEKMEEHGK